MKKKKERNKKDFKSLLNKKESVLQNLKKDLYDKFLKYLIFKIF